MTVEGRIISHIKRNVLSIHPKKSIKMAYQSFCQNSSHCNCLDLGYDSEIGFLTPEVIHLRQGMHIIKYAMQAFLNTGFKGV